MNQEEQGTRKFPLKKTKENSIQQVLKLKSYVFETRARIDPVNNRLFTWNCAPARKRPIKINHLQTLEIFRRFGFLSL